MSLPDWLTWKNAGRIGLAYLVGFVGSYIATLIFVALGWFNIISSYYIPAAKVIVSMLIALIVYSVLFVILVPLALVVFGFASGIQSLWGGALAFVAIIYAGSFLLRQTDNLLYTWFHLDKWGWGPTVWVPAVTYEVIAGGIWLYCDKHFKNDEK